MWVPMLTEAIKMSIYLIGGFIGLALCPNGSYHT